MRLGGAVRWFRTPAGLLAVVSLLHSLSSLLLVGVHHPFGYDETVYLSQINGHRPATLFSAPRARGLTLVVAPVTIWTSSVAAVRLWLAAVTGVGMFFAFRVWRRLTDGYVVPLAALLFSSLWTTIYYGDEAMPNIYVALLAVAAVGGVFRYRQDSRLRWLAAIGLCFAAMALVRPSDALYAVVPLVVAVAVVAGLTVRERLWLGAALVGGFVAGALEWVIEAYVRFGDPVSRLRVAQAEQGPGGLHFSFDAQAHALDGPLLCRGSCPVTAPGWSMAWWAVGAGLLVVGLWTVRRAAAPMTVATVVGVALALEYLITVDYGAARFFTPTYALLSLPVAAGLVALVRLAPGRATLAAGALAALVLAAHIASQVHIMRGPVMAASDATLHRFSALARAIRAQLPPGGHCVLGGTLPTPVAFEVGCGSLPTDPARAVAAASRPGTTVLWLTPRRTLPPQLAGWHVVRLRTPSLAGSWFVAEPSATGG